ncbi:hypothetical protein E4U43_003671 [Claviceps pusilla]|uniref:Uncharacterized protein n=1 Tax=Claviceps pusilla TaxID=123648 RepID=A0A9P7NFE0_9HYPO|nr:hypothetical protein E4U43_003671 [Claviceps pusilla]
MSEKKGRVGESKRSTGSEEVVAEEELFLFRSWSYGSMHYPCRTTASNERLDFRIPERPGPDSDPSRLQGSKTPRATHVPNYGRA